jgi:selenoprotein W-related protein
MHESQAKPKIVIRYCTQCRWLLRAAWMAQELLSTFADDIGEVALAPAKGGVFEIWAGESLLWSRERDGGFPDPGELKTRVRDAVAPQRDLGHIDRKNKPAERGPHVPD